MKTRDSGMPPEELWQSFFDPATVLSKLELDVACQSVVDVGCGYGTFSIPAAKIIRGMVYAFDIDPDMVRATTAKAESLGVKNIEVQQRDFVTSGCGLDVCSADYVMLFNILHAAEAGLLLAEARRVLNENGILAVIHWNYDPSTPRGPAMPIRPKPDQCQQIVESAGFQAGDIVDLPPYHFGFTARPSKHAFHSDDQQALR